MKFDVLGEYWKIPIVSPGLRIYQKSVFTGLILRRAASFRLIGEDFAFQNRLALTKTKQLRTRR